MDKDKDGNINPLELRRALLQGGVPVPPEPQFQAMFSATDVDKNGYIDYVEFVAVMLESSSVAQWVSVFTLFFHFYAYCAGINGLHLYCCCQHYTGELFCGALNQCSVAHCFGS